MLPNTKQRVMAKIDQEMRQLDHFFIRKRSLRQYLTSLTKA